MDREEIKVLLLEIFRELAAELKDAAQHEDQNDVKTTLYRVASAVDGLQVEYHVSQLDELVSAHAEENS